MSDTTRIKLNWKQWFHKSQYFIHILEDIDMNEKFTNIELDVLIQRQINDIDKCSICQEKLKQFVLRHSSVISTVQLTIQHYPSFHDFITDSEMISVLRTLNVKNLVIKFIKMDVECYGKILSQLERLFQQMESLTLDIGFSTSSDNNQAVSILKSVSDIKNLKSLSLKLRSVKWDDNQFGEFFERDTKFIPHNLESMSISLIKLTLPKSQLNFLSQFQEKLSNSLRSFNLTLDYVIGDVIFTQELLSKAIELESFKLQITSGGSLHDVTQIIASACKYQSLKDLSLNLFECDLPVTLALEIIESMQNLKSLQSLQLGFVPQKITMKTQRLKQFFTQYEQKVKNLISQNRNLNLLQINSANQSTKTLLDAVGFYENIQFTNFFTQQIFPSLKELKYIDCNYSGVSRYLVCNQQDFNTFQLKKNNDFLSFLSNNPQLQKLVINEIIVNSRFLKQFSESVCRMRNLTHLEIEFRENLQAQEEEVEQLELFENTDSLEFVKLEVSNLNKYVNIFKNKNIKELTLKQYNQFILFEKLLLQFKVQKLICKQMALIRRLTKEELSSTRDFTKIIVLEEGGNDIFQLLDCVVVDQSKRLPLFTGQRHAFQNFLVFYKYYYSHIIYSPQQTLFDLYENLNN